jgi:hypothetical protein
MQTAEAENEPDLFRWLAAAGCAGFEAKSQNGNLDTAGWFVIHGRGDVETSARVLLEAHPHSTDNVP